MLSEAAAAGGTGLRVRVDFFVSAFGKLEGFASTDSNAAAAATGDGAAVVSDRCSLEGETASEGGSSSRKYSRLRTPLGSCSRMTMPTAGSSIASRVRMTNSALSPTLSTDTSARSMKVTAAFGGRAPSEKRDDDTESSTLERSMGILTCSGLPNGDNTRGVPIFKRGVCAETVPWQIAVASNTATTFAHGFFAIRKLPMSICILTCR